MRKKHLTDDERAELQRKTVLIDLIIEKLCKMDLALLRIAYQSVSELREKQRDKATNTKEKGK